MPSSAFSLLQSGRRRRPACSALSSHQAASFLLPPRSLQLQLCPHTPQGQGRLPPVGSCVLTAPVAVGQAATPAEGEKGPEGPRSRALSYPCSDLLAGTGRVFLWCIYQRGN